MDEEEYGKQLERLYSKIPKDVTQKERFDVPVPQTESMGNRTYIQNFKKICEVLNRDESHLLKFLAKELATAGIIEGDKAVLQGKFKPPVISRVFDDYVHGQVLCPVCRSPDTTIVKEERFRFLTCEACGAKSSIKPV
ncbi:MAG: translation initiation factor IF-2 subunit beta [Candidatus Bathyarchaeota archaeon]